VPVYDAGSGTGRLLAIDLDPGRVRSDVDDVPVGQRHERGGTEVGRQAAAIVAVVAGLGGLVLADIAPSGGRHVYVLFSAPLPWRELRDLCRAIAARFDAVDPAPMTGLGGQISPPGSRHKSGGWRLLSIPVVDALAAVEHPNGPEVWAALLDEFAAELALAERGEHVDAERGEHVDNQFFAAAELDDAGVPWVPRLGGRTNLGPELASTARTGRWDRTRHPGRSEARMAVLTAAASRGWRLADVRAAMASGAWKGLPELYYRASEPGRMERLLPLEWKKAVAFVARDGSVRGWHTSQNFTPPAVGGPALSAEYGLIRTWPTVILIALEDPERVKRWGGRVIAVRLVLLALAQAAAVSGSPVVEFGCRNLSLYSGGRPSKPKSGSGRPPRLLPG
jgi:hypothetical protein